MRNNFATLILILFFLSGCGLGQERVVYTELVKNGGLMYYQGKPFNGVAFIMYDEKQAIADPITFKDGKLDGVLKRWYKNGQLQDEETWKNGKEDGVHKSWYEDGKLKSEETYKDGEMDGVQRAWHYNGQKWYDHTYKDGESVGDQRAWDVDGKIISNFTK